MKTCGKCSEEKTFEAFSLSKRSKDGRQAYCKDCMRAYDRNRYLTTDRPADVRRRYEASRDRNIDWLEEYLANKRCVDCGIDDRRVLQFDHKDRKTKSGMVSVMVRTHGLTALQAEVAKCEIRCANCHMIRTGEQFGWRHAIVSE